MSFQSFKHTKIMDATNHETRNMKILQTERKANEDANCAIKKS